MDAPAVVAPVRHARYPLGVAMVLTAGACLSLGGLILRNIEAADGWQVMFYRSIAFTVTLSLYIAVRYRGRMIRPFLRIGRTGPLLSLLLGLGSVCYVFAILETTVANVMFILSTTPLWTALLAWAVLRERVRASTWVAMLAAVAGIGLMVVNGLATGRILGNLLAFGAVAGFAGMVVILRRSQHVDMVPATCLAGVVAAALSALMVEGFAVSGHDLALSLLLGTVQYGAGFLFITLGARYVPAAEVSLLALSEIILAPTWVWIFVDEVPAALTLAGGAMVLAAVVGQALVGLHRERAARRRARLAGR